MRRRRLWFLLFVILFVNSGTYSQEKIGLSFKVGINHANMAVVHKETGERLKTQARNNPFFLLEFEYRFAKIFSYVAGVSYLQQGYAVRKYSGEDYPYTYYRDLRYVGIVQKGRVTFSFPPVEIFTALGVSGEALISAKYHRQYDRNAKPAYSIDEKDWFNSGMIIPEWDAGVGLLVGPWRISAELTVVIGGDDIGRPERSYAFKYTRKFRDVRYFLGITRYFE
jgi:hypothetical protein